VWNHQNERGNVARLGAWMLGFAATLCLMAGCHRAANQSDAPASLTADQVMQAMMNAYQHSEAYRDQAVVRLRYRQNGRLYQDEAPLSVTWKAPGQLNVCAYQASVVCDGQQMYARIMNDLSSQSSTRATPC
jgi:hypothetical protein